MRIPSALLAIAVAATACHGPIPGPGPPLVELYGPPHIVAIHRHSLGFDSPNATTLEPAGIVSVYSGLKIELVPELDTGESPLTWRWDLGGGATPGVAATHAVAIVPGPPGSYASQFTATNELGSHTFPFTLQVLLPPIPVLSIQEFQGYTTAPITINSDYVPYRTVVESWSWDFGGGATPNTSTQARPEVILGPVGDYTGHVSVSNAGGTNTYEFILRSVPLIAPQLRPLNTVGTPTPWNAWTGHNVYPYVANDGGPAISWLWDFGGAGTPATSTAEHPELTLGAPGTYHGTVTATNAAGSSTVELTFIVKPVT
jgi:PKD repeat protein